MDGHSTSQSVGYEARDIHIADYPVYRVISFKFLLDYVHHESRAQRFEKLQSD